MDKSVLVSSGTALTVTQLVPAVDWALSGFKGAVPESVPAILAGVIVAIVHGVINWINSRPQVPQQKPPEAPTA